MYKGGKEGNYSGDMLCKVRLLAVRCKCTVLFESCRVWWDNVAAGDWCCGAEIAHDRTLYPWRVFETLGDECLVLRANHSIRVAVEPSRSSRREDAQISMSQCTSETSILTDC